MEDILVSVNTRQQREVLFTDLYKKAFPSVAAYVSKMGGSFDEAKDVFHDALVVYYEKMQDPFFELNTNEKAYLLGISKNLWVRKFTDQKQFLSLDQSPLTDFKTLDDKKVSSEKLLGFLEKAGKKCMEILRAFYYDKLDTSQIATRFGYSSVRSATVQKYKCLEKVRDKVKEKSLEHEDFTE